MSVYWSKSMCLCLFVFFVGCKGMHSRPSSVPHSAVWVDGTFVDCSADMQSKANRCSVYKDDSGEILAEGLFVLGTTDKGADNSELHFVAFGEQGIYLDDLKILRQRTATDRDPSHRVFDERLKTIASKGGTNALDCGEWTATGDADTVTECALAAFEHKKPFYVRYYEPGNAHFSYNGIASDSDRNFYGAFYSSGRTVWMGGAGKDGQILDGNHTLILPCPKPPALTKTRTGILTCFTERIN
jgi:hypothetical protein